MNDLLMKSSKIKYKSLIPSTEVIQLTLTLKITTAHVLETSVTVNNNSPIHNHVHPDHEEFFDTLCTAWNKCSFTSTPRNTN